MLHFLLFSPHLGSECPISLARFASRKALHGGLGQEFFYKPQRVIFLGPRIWGNQLRVFFICHRRVFSIPATVHPIPRAETWVGWNYRDTRTNPLAVGFFTPYSPQPVQPMQRRIRQRPDRGRSGIAPYEEEQEEEERSCFGRLRRWWWG